MWSLFFSVFVRSVYENKKKFPWGSPSLLPPDAESRSEKRRTVVIRRRAPLLVPLTWPPNREHNTVHWHAFFVDLLCCFFYSLLQTETHQKFGRALICYRFIPRCPPDVLGLIQSLFLLHFPGRLWSVSFNGIISDRIVWRKCRYIAGHRGDVLRNVFYV